MTTHEPFMPVDPEVAAVHRRHPNIPQDPLPCFDPDDKPVAKRVSDKPKWSRYQVKKTVRCDDCTTVLAMAQGHGPLALPARFQRRLGDDVKRVCTLHMAERTRQEGRPPLPDENEFNQAARRRAGRR